MSMPFTFQYREFSLDFCFVKNDLLYLKRKSLPPCNDLMVIVVMIHDTYKQFP